jgi:hypothetical protein
MPRPKKQKIPIEDEDKLEEKHAVSHPRKKENENLRAGWKTQLLKSGRKGKLTNYARAIGVGISYPNNRNKKLPPDKLVENILDRAIHLKRSLHQNWISRVDDKRPIYRSQNVENMSNSQLRKVAKQQGIPVHGRTDEMIREAINIQDPSTNVDEKELDNDAHFTRYNIDVIPDNRLDSVKSTAHNVPYDKAEAWLLINWILKNQTHPHAGKIPYIVTRGYVETVGHDNNTGNEKTRRDNSYFNTRGFRLEAGETQISMEEITEMFMAIDDYFQLMLGRSDMFCQIVRFVQLDVIVTYIEPAGAGFVLLLNPAQFPSIISPRTNCIFESLEGGGFKSKTSIPDIMTALGIKSQFVPVRCIPQILEYYEPHARVYLYYSDKKSERFVLRDIIETPDPETDIHIGFLPHQSHYIYIGDPNDLKELNPYKDFRRFKTKHEELLSILEEIIVRPDDIQVDLNVLESGEIKLAILPLTKIPIVSHLLESVAGRELYENSPLNEVSHRIIQKKIKSYQHQDKRAGREVSPLSPEMVCRLIDKSPYCPDCSRKLTCSNWTLNRIDSEKSHSEDNIEITCLHCNVTKKDSKHEVIVSDFEAFPDGGMNKNGHREGKQIPYAVVFSKYDYNKLEHNEKLDTEIHYGLDTMEEFENTMIRLSKKKQKEVERRTNNYMDWYKNSSVYVETKENMIFNYTSKANFYIEKCGRLLKKNENNREIALSNAIKKYRKEATMAKHNNAIELKYTRKADEISSRYNQYLKKTQENYEKNYKEILDNARERKYNKLTKALRTLVYFHFGSKYDGQFVFKSKRLEFDRIIERFGLMSIVLKGEFVEIRDSMRLTGAVSLEKLGKGYGLSDEDLKKNFPHDFICRETLYYIGAPPPAKYWALKNGKREIPKEFIGKEWDTQKNSREYIHNDATSLLHVLHRLRKSIMEVTHLDIFDFISMPALAIKYLCENFPKNKVFVAENPSVDAFHRSAFQGGRCIPIKPCFVSKDEAKIMKHWNIYSSIKKKLNENTRQYQIDRDAWTKKLNDEQEILLQLLDSCQDYLDDADGVSLYPSVQILYPFPSGVSYFETDVEMVKTAINSCGINFPLGIIDCDIEYPSQTTCILPIIGIVVDSGNLEYNTKSKRVTRTTVDLMDEVHFSKAKITRVYTAELWTEKEFLFRDALLKLFAMRIDAKKKLLLAFAEALKILMNGGGGKFGQSLIEITHIIIDIENYYEVIDYYRKGQVCYHDLLANGKQYLVELQKNRLPKVEIPSHLYAFILSYGRHHVNLCIDVFDGFDNWDKTIHYTDTDSIFIHHKQYQELEKAKLSDYLKLLDESLIGYGGDEKEKIIGKGVGQFHDDIKEVDKGKIIQQSNDAPKFKCDKIIGISKETPILELLEKVFRKYNPAPFSLPNTYQTLKIENIIKHYCHEEIKIPVFCDRKITDTIKGYCEELNLQDVSDEYEKGIKKITGTIQDYCKECIVDYHKVNKNISPEGSEEQLTMNVFEDLLKQDQMTGKRNIFTVKNERIFKKSFKDGKCAGITTVYRDKEIGRNGGWNGRILDSENNRWIPKSEPKNYKSVQS